MKDTTKKATPSSSFDGAPSFSFDGVPSAFLFDGRIVGVSGGLYKIELYSDGGAEVTVFCRARGAFRHEGTTPLVGDNVRVRCDRDVFDEGEDKSTNVMIESIGERKNALIRPPMANLDCIFVTLSVASPAPILLTTDKLIAIAEHNSIEPLLVIGKCELDRSEAERIRGIYEKSGIRVFTVSCRTGEGIDGLRDYINANLRGKIAAFSGVSGVGKSSLMNALFPHLSLETGDISKRIERGKNTTRSVDICKISTEGGVFYIADTPGFSMLDFEHFDFFGKDDLPYTFREFVPFIGKCKYTKCTHTKEDGCAILGAVNDGLISKSRHDSFLELYSVLKNKNDWNK